MAYIEPWFTQSSPGLQLITPPFSLQALDHSIRALSQQISAAGGDEGSVEAADEEFYEATVEPEMTLLTVASAGILSSTEDISASSYGTPNMWFADERSDIVELEEIIGTEVIY